MRGEIVPLLYHRPTFHRRAQRARLRASAAMASLYQLWLGLWVPPFTVHTELPCRGLRGPLFHVRAASNPAATINYDTTVLLCG